MKNSVLAKLQAMSLANKLPHAWLFTGVQQNIKLEVARAFSQWLLCEQVQISPQALACGICKACHLFLANTHPDFCLITNAADQQSIVLDDVRRITDFIVSKPQFAQRKIVLLYPAEMLHKNAANFLLKNLEEPQSNTLFILITKNSALLLPTIVSRCPIVNFIGGDAQMLASGIVVIEQMFADIAGLWLDHNVTASQIIDRWLKQWPHEVLYWLELVLSDLILFKYTQDLALLRYGSSYNKHAQLSNALTSSNFWSMLDRLKEAQYWLGKQHNPNMQLLLEDILMV